MKKFILTTAAMIMLLIPLRTFSQSTTDDLFEKYGAKDGFTTVHITKELFSLFGEIAEESDDEDASDLKNVINGLDYIRILMYENSNDNEYADPGIFREFKDDLKKVQLKNFAELMTVSEPGETVKFLIRKNGKNIKELLLLINQKDEAGFISITGNIDLKSIAKLSKAMNIDGLEQLEKMNKEKEEDDD
jgi:hypothetical protein